MVCPRKMDSPSVTPIVITNTTDLCPSQPTGTEQLSSSRTTFSICASWYSRFKCSLSNSSPGPFPWQSTNTRANWGTTLFLQQAQSTRWYRKWYGYEYWITRLNRCSLIRMCCCDSCDGFSMSTIVICTNQPSINLSPYLPVQPVQLVLVDVRVDVQLVDHRHLLALQLPFELDRRVQPLVQSLPLQLLHHSESRHHLLVPPAIHPFLPHVALAPHRQLLRQSRQRQVVQVAVLRYTELLAHLLFSKRLTPVLPGIESHEHILQVQQSLQGSLHVHLHVPELGVDRVLLAPPLPVMHNRPLIDQLVDVQKGNPLLWEVLDAEVLGLVGVVEFILGDGLLSPETVLDGDGVKVGGNGQFSVVLRGLIGGQGERRQVHGRELIGG